MGRKEMGRKKIDRESLEYITSKLLWKDDIIGFQFTAGNTPLGIIKNEPLYMRCTVNKSQRSVIGDSYESELERKIEKTIFGEGHTITMEKLRNYQEQFRKLNYEVEEAEFAGIWYWFRIHCKSDEIVKHVNNLKENFII